MFGIKLNKIFKKIWCVKRKTFVLTYENRAAKRKSGFTFSGISNLTLLGFLKILINAAMLTLATNALGEGYNPVDVVSGKVNIIINDQKNHAVVNQSTQKAIINWQSFSVPKNGSAIFNQPNSTSITLNRVIGKHKSFIDGKINANGQVWILNPNGTLVGKNGSINAHGFMAATHSISNSDFLKGNYKFNVASDNNNMVSNSGKISVGSGYAVLAGKEVNNNGVIVASIGKIALASSKTFTVDIVGDNLLSFEVNKGLDGKNAGISSIGQLKAVDGQIFLTASDAEQIVSSVTNAGDMVQANNVKIVGDSIVFTKKTSASLGGPDNFQEPGEIFFEQGGDFVEPARDFVEPVRNFVEPNNNSVEQTGDSQTTLEQTFTGAPSEEEDEEERHGHISGEEAEQNPKFDIVIDNSVSPINQFDSNNPVQVTFPSGSGSNLVGNNDQFNNQFDPNNSFQGPFPSGSGSNLVGNDDQFYNDRFPIQTFDAEIIGPNDFPINAPNKDFTAQPIGPNGQFVLVGPGGQVISPDGQPLNEQFLEPGNNIPLTPFNPEKDRTEFLAQYGGDKLDPCVVEPILCSSPEFGFQNNGQPFDPNQFFSNNFADNLLDPFKQPVEGNIVDFQESPVSGNVLPANNQFDSADFFIAIDRTGLQGDELAGTFEQFGDAERFIETANLASEFGFDVRDVAEFAGKVDEKIFQETFSDVAEVAQKVNGTIIDDLAFIAAREGGTVGDVLESAIDESYDVVRQVSNMTPPSDFAPPPADFGDVGGGPPPGGDFGGGPTDIVGDPGIGLGLPPGDLGGPPKGDFGPGAGDIGDLAGGPGPGEFLAPAPTDFASPIPGDLAALPGEFAPPPGLDLGDIGEFGAEAASFGDFTEFGDVGAPPPGDVGSPSPGKLGSVSNPGGDIGAPPPKDIIDGGPPPGDVPSPGGDSLPLADGPDGPLPGDGQPPGDGPQSGELIDGPAGDQPPPESAEAPGDDIAPGGADDAVASDVGDSTPEIASDGPATVDSPPANDSLPAGDAVAGDVSPPANVSPADAVEAPSSAPAPVAVTADVAPPPPPPVEPPPPSPVPTQKAPTPVDSADAGDKTLAAVAPPSPPKPASQPQAVSVKTVPVVPGGVVNVQVPVPPRPPAGLASSPKIPSVGNSSNW